MQAVVALSLASRRGRLFDQLAQMLQDKNVEVRQAVVASLADVKSERATAALHKAVPNGRILIGDTAGYLRLSAIEAGARMRMRSTTVPSTGAQEQAWLRDLVQ